ncbi:MAG: hypothetical protein ACI9AR_000424 [Flavobacteriaceae bacterium]|jgi:hypothetical protein
MNNIEKQLHKLKQVKLSEDKRESIRYALIEHMQKPATSNRWNFSFAMRYSMAFVFTIIVAGGGLSYVAAASLPGDVLYPIKIHVSEKAEIALTPQAHKIEIKKKHVENRFKEIEILAKEDKLTEETQVIAQEQLQKDFDEFDAAITALEETDSVAIALAATASMGPVVEHYSEIIEEITKNNISQNAISRTIVADAKAKVATLNKKEEVLIVRAEKKEEQNVETKESIREIAETKINLLQEKVTNFNTIALEISYTKNILPLLEDAPVVDANIDITQDGNVALVNETQTVSIPTSRKLRSLSSFFESENLLLDAQIYFHNENYGEAIRSSQKALKIIDELNRFISDESYGEFSPEHQQDNTFSDLQIENDDLIKEIDALDKNEEPISVETKENITQPLVIEKEIKEKTETTFTPQESESEIVAVI